MFLFLIFQLFLFFPSNAQVIYPYNLTQPAGPSLNFSGLLEPNLPASALTDLGWVSLDSESFTTFDFGDGLTYYGFFTGSLFQHFPAPKITYAVCFLNISMNVRFESFDSNYYFPLIFTNNNTIINMTLEKYNNLVNGWDFFCMCFSAQLSITSFVNYKDPAGWDAYIGQSALQTASLVNYAVSKISIEYYNCSSNCKECRWIESDSCIECYDNSWLDNGTCRCMMGYFWEEHYPCPSDDVSTCFYCTICDPSCKGCVGPNDDNCNLCASNKYLHQGQCIDQCPVGLFSNEMNLTNKTCETVCPDGSFLHLDQKLCLKNCTGLSGYFEEKTLNQCIKCDAVCKECANTQSYCIACDDSMFSYENTCVNVCPNKYFLNGKICENCDVSCENCEGNATNCSICSEYFYLHFDKNSCEVDCPQAFYKENTTKTCKECDSKCQECLNLSFCFICKGSFTLNQGLCSEPTVISRTPIKAFINSTDNPLLFLLNFNHSSNPIFSALNNDRISLLTTTNLSFIHQIKPSSTFSKTFELSFQIFSPYNLTQYPFLLKINETNLNTIYFLIENPLNFLLDLRTYHSKPIDFEISFLNNQYPLYLKFTLEGKVMNLSENPAILQSILINSLISISNLTNSQYKSSISLIKNQDFLQIPLNFTTSIHHSNILTYSLTSNFSENLHRNFSLIKNFSTISLLEYYYISSETMLLINKTSDFIQETIQISQGISYLNSFLNIISFLSLRVLILVDLLRYFRFININYPRNMLKLFESGLNLGQNMNAIDFVESPEDASPEGKFEFYQISNYFLNNSNISLLQLAATYFLALFFIYLAKKSSFFASSIDFSWYQNKEKCGFSLFLKCLINLVFKLIVWNFIIAQFLSSFNENMLYCLINLYWPPVNSQVGTANFIFGICYFIFLMFSVVFFFFMIRQLRKIHQKFKQNAVMPFEENKENSSNFEEKKTTNFKENMPNNQTLNLEDLENNNKKNKLTNMSNGDFEDFFDMSPQLPASHKQQSNILFNNPQGHPVIPWDKIKDLLEFSKQKSFAATIKNLQIIRDVNTASSPRELIEKRQVKLSPFHIKIPRISEISVEETTARTKNTNLETTPEIKKKSFSKEKIEESLEIKEKKQKTLKDRYFILFKGMNNEKRNHSYFILYEMGRQMAISFLLVVLWNKPLLNIMIIETINFFFFLAVAFLRPYKEKKDWILALTTDIGLNIAGIMCFLLAYMGDNSDFDEEKRMNLGWVFVVTNCVLIMIMLCIYLFQLLRFIWMIIKLSWKFYQKRRNRNQKVFSQGNSKEKEEIQVGNSLDKQENVSEEKSENVSDLAKKKKKYDRKIPRKTLNDKIKDTLELNGLFMT